MIDFKEIAQANLGSGQQDDFEVFAVEFLEFLGFKIVQKPSRGADRGKDAIVEETRTGIGGETKKRWLVSCKHFAHSGKSVGPTSENNILDRVNSHNCDGFIGVYSTIPSSGLDSMLNGLAIDWLTFSKREIEKKLLKDPKGHKILVRYFPASFKKWEKNNPKPAKIFAEKPAIDCEYCNKSLINDEPSGIIVHWEDANEVITDIYFSCKGHCDRALKSRFNGSGKIDGWEDIPDIIIPTMYLRWVIGTINEINDGQKYSQDAFKKLKHFLINIYPFVVRDLTDKEKKRFDELKMIPWLFN